MVVAGLADGLVRRCAGEAVVRLGLYAAAVAVVRGCHPNSLRGEASAVGLIQTDSGAGASVDRSGSGGDAALVLEVKACPAQMVRGLARVAAEDHAGVLDG
jgi:hypothetical protein